MTWQHTQLKEVLYTWYDSITDIFKLDNFMIVPAVSHLCFSLCAFSFCLCDIEVCSGAICVQFWPQAKETSSIPYTCMCAQCPQIQHTGMIVPVKNPGKWFHIVLSWIIMPITRPISWIQFTNYKYSNLGHMSVPGIGDQVLLRVGGKRTLWQTDNCNNNKKRLIRIIQKTALIPFLFLLPSGPEVFKII